MWTFAACRFLGFSVQTSLRRVLAVGGCESPHFSGLSVRAYCGDSDVDFHSVVALAVLMCGVDFRRLIVP